MAYKETTALKKVLALKKRLRIIQGGSSAGKTIAILLILIDIAQSVNNKIISVVSESVPHLRRGSITDFLSILTSQNYYNDKQWNRTNFIYTFETGSKIEFFSADFPNKVRGPRRDILFINEANNISYDTYTQLVIRTNETVFIDYNPVSEFWVHTELIPTQDLDFIILTYKDNEFLSEEIVKELESRKGKKWFWKVYGEGLIGEIEGKIYKDWQIIDEIPHEARLERYGLDFGYTSSQSAIVAIYYYNGGYILDEIVYKTKLLNRHLADIILNQDAEAMVVADSAEPKSIDEIKEFGINIIGATKGKDSVSHGIQTVQDQQISVTKRSLNIIKEYRNYIFQADRQTGNTTNVPQDFMDHCMSAIRYAFTTINKAPTNTILNEMKYVEQRQQRIHDNKSDAGL